MPTCYAPAYYHAAHAGISGNKSGKVGTGAGILVDFHKLALQSE